MRTPINSVLLGLDLLISKLTDKDFFTDATHVVFELKETLGTSIGILDNLRSVEKLRKGILHFQKTLIPTFTLILDTISPFICMVIIIIFL